MSIFAETECSFSPVGTVVYTALIHRITCWLEARQALIYQLVSGLTGENGKYNYSKAVHVYPPFFDIPCSAKNYKIAPALTLAKMDIDYIDLMLIHAPQPWADFRGGDYAEGNRQAWKALEDAYKAGKLRAIGVSNFKIEDMENLLSSCTVTPMVNQLLIHISNTPSELIEYCQRKNIVVEAYSPVAHGEILQNPQIAQMAVKYGMTVAQLCIRYCLQLGTLPLPKTGNPIHMEENARLDFEISSEDMAALRSIDKIKDYGEFSVFPVFSGK